MDIEYLYIISIVIFLFLVLKLLQTKKSDEVELDSEISSYTFLGVFILVMLFTDNVKLLFALIFISIPFCSIGFYRRYKKNKKETMISLSIFAAILLVIWTAAL